MKKKRMLMTTSGIASLTDGILVDILSRLPAKVVGQCKCICKHWCLLIEDPSFVHSHCACSKSRQDCRYLFISIIDCHRKNVYFYSANYHGGPGHHLRTDWDMGHACLKQSVEGLICRVLALARSKTWTKRDHLDLPIKKNKRDHLDGFKEMDDKVYDYESELDDFDKLYDYECEVFTLGTHSWRKLDDVPFHFEFGAGSRCVDGVIFWRNTRIRLEENHTPGEDVTVAFDLKDEKF
ncbi:putative F-box protein At3g10240 [Rhododendron vialii]|uniref:putative F-box protein At3g10240 n=1 Tax=Rhododendron vialii TaxID=182163 RepID=UPI00265DC41A|nr:putative F-box protein At3g10240 [Rhododendron vialii]